MANSLCFTSVCSFKSPNKPGLVNGNSLAGKFIRINELFQSSKTAKCQPLEVRDTHKLYLRELRLRDQEFVPTKATGSNQSTKPSSIVCDDCDGNGAVLCSQCKGTGVNSVDHFNGQFKAGGLCWLCRGKREILCGNCNGAGFVGGFMSSFDE